MAVAVGIGVCRRMFIGEAENFIHFNDTVESHRYQAFKRIDKTAQEIGRFLDGWASHPIQIA